MKIELHFKTVVEVSQEDYENNELELNMGSRVFFPIVHSNSLLRDYLHKSPPFIFTGYSIMPELEDQINKLKNLL